jgi:outer membrane receptor protein involved in Fe transport
LNTYVINTPIAANAMVTLPTTNNNPNLNPERTKSFETGLEMSFLKNRVGFDFTYFASKTFDLITQVNASGATGYLSQYVNFGSIQNNGIELSLNGTPIKTRNFS